MRTGNYEKRTEAIKGSSLKSRDYRVQLEYKGNWVAERYIDDEKTYVVHIHESEDSEGWIHIRYQIDDGYPEFEKMLEDREFTEAVEKEVNKKESEYFDKQREKYEKLSKEQLIDKLIQAEKDIKWVFKCRI